MAYTDCIKQRFPDAQVSALLQVSAFLSRFAASFFQASGSVYVSVFSLAAWCTTETTHVITSATESMVGFFPSARVYEFLLFATHSLYQVRVCVPIGSLCCVTCHWQYRHTHDRCVMSAVCFVTSVVVETLIAGSGAGKLTCLRCPCPHRVPFCTVVISHALV